MSVQPEPPKAFTAFTGRYPRLAEAWELIAEEGKDGPLDDKTARLVKLGVAIGALRQGAVHSGARKALAMGITREELEQTVALAAGTLGMPSTVAAYCWVEDIVGPGDSADSKSVETESDPGSAETTTSTVSSKSGEQLKSLLDGSRLLGLGVLVEGRPYVGQVPFAVWPGRGSLLIHVSALARHTRGLGAGVRWSGLIGAAAEPESDPFQIPRVSLEGTVRRVERDDDDYDEARAAYLERLPSGRLHFSLGDFSLIELEVSKGRLVAGFGSTFNLTAAHLRDL